MASIVNSKLYYAMLQIAKSENIGSRLQFASIAGCRTRSVEIYRVVFAWCKLLPILHFRLFLGAIEYRQCGILIYKYTNSVQRPTNY